jgi:hypothetical protein
MPKPNNPYARPVHATKESAQTIGEYYGTLAKTTALNHAAGGRNASPASRFQAVGNAYVPPMTPSHDTTSPKKPKSKVLTEPVTIPITAEDLFGP